MPAEIDFSKGQRGQFFRPGTKLNLPVYLDAPLQARLAALAEARGWSSPSSSTLLKKDLELIEGGAKECRARYLLGRLASQHALTQRLDALEATLTEHDQAIAEIVKAIRQLMLPPDPPKKRQIGFVRDE
ncbi:MAG: hypothetical protein IPM75_14515 [Candidatus Competibacteraceae bacterium]|nr:hypothetical protein [Candidatus Competibacteraceae bacterium]